MTNASKTLRNAPRMRCRFWMDKYTGEMVERKTGGILSE